MTYFYVLKDSKVIARCDTREEAIDLIRQKQKRETHPILKAGFSILPAGDEEYIPYERS